VGIQSATVTCQRYELSDATSILTRRIRKAQNVFEREIINSTHEWRWGVSLFLFLRLLNLHEIPREDGQNKPTRAYGPPIGSANIINKLKKKFFNIKKKKKKKKKKK
jgi:hypothetical protein